MPMMDGNFSEPLQKLNRVVKITRAVKFLKTKTHMSFLNGFILSCFSFISGFVFS